MKLFTSFNANIEWTDGLEIIAIIFLICYREFDISQQEKIYIDDEYIRFYLNNKKEAQLKISDVKTVVWVKDPKHTILILSPTKVIEIPGLQNEMEFKALLLGLFFVLYQKGVIQESQLPQDTSMKILSPVLEETLQELHGKNWRVA
ncbi:MAG: hypothetical protein SFW36_07000 [Leptolyngbyaceae cyanobacterium bins.59]|nr:hypothetical protein [Leptolyngbyaceae cyanobacterium bins.59]